LEYVEKNISKMLREKRREEIEKAVEEKPFEDYSDPYEKTTRQE
jgi:hypothetical protein